MADRLGGRGGTKGEALPLPPIDVLAGQLQYAYEQIRGLLEPRQDQTNVGMHNFIRGLVYRGEPLDPRIILPFLKKLGLITNIRGGSGKRSLWKVLRAGHVDLGKVQDLIGRGEVPREHVPRGQSGDGGMDEAYVEGLEAEVARLRERNSVLESTLAAIGAALADGQSRLTQLV